MRRHPVLVALLSAAVAAAACDPRDFGDTLKRAPLQVTELGSARVLVPLPPPADAPKVAARLLLATAATRSLAVADLDANGVAAVHQATEMELGDLGDSGPILSAVALGDGKVALGMPHYGQRDEPNSPPPPGRVALLTISPTSGGKPSFSISPSSKEGTDHFGLALAKGRVTGAPEELVVVSDTLVAVLSPTTLIGPSTTCAGALKTPSDRYRSLAVANLIGTAGDDVVIGMPVQGGRGSVHLISHGVAPGGTGKPELYCARKLDTPNGGGGFGTALAVADFDGDGQDDLAVGAPPDRVFVYLGPIDGAPPDVEIAMDPHTNFGARLLAVNLDGGNPELLVSSLTADVGETASAGQAHLYKIAGAKAAASKQLLATINDGNPDSNSLFGIALAELPYKDTSCAKDPVDAHVLVVSSDQEVFTFFNFAGSPPDPRCFARRK